MIRKTQFLLIIFVLALILPFGAYAHPGRTNVSGCHVCKTNCESWGLKNGENHCHGEKVKMAKVEVKKEAKTNAKSK